MTELLRIFTFGGLSIQQVGGPVKGFISRKADALFVYLACEPGEHPRELLGELLWDDLSQDRTMGNLRTALSSLQSQLAPYLCVTRQSISINAEASIWLDVQSLESELNNIEHQSTIQGGLSRAAAHKLSQTLTLFKGDFLAGFNLRGSRGFEGWQMLQRERLRGRVIDAQHRLVEYFLKSHQYSVGIVQAQTLLQLDPLWEDTHRQLMMLYSESGQRSAALAQFESCRAVLEAELGVEPDSETTALYTSIQSGTVAKSVEVKVPPHNLPLLRTPFIDRPVEMEHVSTALANMQCRLLTILGPGGCGKTRLALQVAASRLSNFADGVFFVNLAPVQTPELLISTLLDTFPIERNRQNSELIEIVNYLSHKQALLVLDNFEQLVTSAEVIADLLVRCPNIKLLITSRERLNIQHEWIIALNGLPYPKTSSADIEMYGAVQLFKQTAQRLIANFSFANTADAVIRICKLVQGMPLAIELAASCLRAQTCAQIADEIALNMDILQTSLRDMPERHRSMRATFETSWGLLTETEQQILARLSVFRGRFERQAGQQVAQSSVVSLLALQDKSLLHAYEGYFELHPLLQQFLNEKLRQKPTEVQHAENDHCLFFTGRLTQYGLQIDQGELLSTVVKIAQDMDNIRAAWDYAIHVGDADLLTRFLKPLYSYFDVQCRYLEGEETFGRTCDLLVERNGSGQVLVARLRVLQGSMLVCMSRYTEAQAVIRDHLAVLQQHSLSWETRIGLSSLGTIFYAFGDYQAAWSFYESALPYYKQAGEYSETVNVLVRLSDIASVLGDYEKARGLLDENTAYISRLTSKRVKTLFLTTLGDLEYKVGNYQAAGQRFEESLILSEQMNDNALLGVSLVSLGRVAYARGNYEDALRFCKKSVDVFRDIHNQWSESFGLSHTGRVYHALGSYPDALAQYTDALAICQAMGNRWVMSFALRQVSRTQLAMGEVTQAAKDTLRSIELAREIDAKPLLLDAFMGAAEVLERMSHVTEAAEIALFLSKNPNSEYETRQSATALLANVQDRVEVASLRENTHEPSFDMLLRVYACL